MNTEPQRHRENDGIYKEFTGAIIAAAIEVHRELGPGLFESVYEECFCRELTLRSLSYRRQIDLPVVYKGLMLGHGYRLDVVVEERVVVELKAVERILPVHKAQLLTYLRITGTPVGLLINFNSPVLTQGIVRRVL
jgi:GxxExxY protein